MEGHEHGAEPIAILGWRVGYLAYFSIPVIYKSNQIDFIFQIIGWITFLILYSKNRTVYSLSCSTLFSKRSPVHPSPFTTLAKSQVFVVIIEGKTHSGSMDLAI